MNDGGFEPDTHITFISITIAHNKVDLGMVGMIIVEDDPLLAPPELLAMDDVVAVAHGLSLANNTADPITKFSNIWATASNGNTSTLALDLDNPFNITTNLLLVNGQYKPTLEMRPGEIKRVRVVNALSTDSLYFGLATDSTAACTMTLLARDGVYIDTPRPETALYVPPAGRTDIAVQCSGAGRAALTTVYSTDAWFRANQGAWVAGTGHATDLQVMMNLI